MKNPFKKRDNTVLIAGIAIGAAAVSVAYLFLTDSGISVRQRLAGLFDQQENETDNNEEDPQAYLKHPTKAPKTDRDALLRNEVLHANDNGDKQS